MTLLVITGTDTNVGKTVTTAALAAITGAAVVKVAQTGVFDGEPGDLAEIARLADVSTLQEFARYPDPLAPAAAARHSGRPTLGLADSTERLRELERRHQRVLVEGAGGLLVDYGGWTVLELAQRLGAPVVLVLHPGLGTLNHTALTLRALGEHPIAGLVISRWPLEPSLVQRCNVGDLATLAAAHGTVLAGVLPEGLVPRADTEVADFAQRARAGLAPALGGEFDAAQFVAKWRL